MRSPVILFLSISLFALLSARIAIMPFDSLVNKLQNLQTQVRDRVEGHIRDQQQGQQQQNSNAPPPPPGPQQPSQTPQPHHHQPQQQQAACHTNNQASPESFAKLRERWRMQLLGDPNQLDRNDPTVQRHIKDLSDTCNTLLERLKIDNDHVFAGTYPLNPTDLGFKDSILKLQQMAMAWATEGTDQYQNEEVVQKIIRGLDTAMRVIYDNGRDKIQECLKTRKNWWGIQIGAPLNLADACIILYDKLGNERRQKWGNMIFEIDGNTAIPSLKGGNRSWIARVLIITGLYMDNDTVLRRGIDALSGVGIPQNTLFGYMKPGQKGEGMYQDGSLLSHDVFPYAGGYGLTMLTSLSILMNLLNSPESPPEYRIKDPNSWVTYESIERNFLPVSWNGIVFDHVRGRGISRPEMPGWSSGNDLMHAAAALAKGCDDPNMTASIEQLIRRWAKDSPIDPLEKASVVQRSILKPILDNQSGGLAKPPVGGFSTPIQEHYVYHGPNGSWCFTLSLCSTRIGRAESLNDENVHSWYQGDGMTYFFTEAHKTHYGDDYWPTMDPYHVPGTTNHQQQITANHDYKTMGFNDWSGGACWSGGGWGTGQMFKSKGIGSRVAVASMNHRSFDRRSVAQKSWFMLEDAVVSLGARCSSDTHKKDHLHTTIESRNLDNEHRRFVLDGQEQSCDDGWQVTGNQFKWAWLEGHAGYIFYDNENKILSRTKRHGNWNDINCNNRRSQCQCCRTYLNIFVDHGIDPQSGQYAYATIPLASEQTTAQLAQNPRWRILSNTPQLQAVEDRYQDGWVIMATFWAPGELAGIRVEQGCQLIWGRLKNVWCLSVSEPTQKVPKVVVNIEDIGLQGLTTGRTSKDITINGNQVIIDRLFDGVTKSAFFNGGSDDVSARRHDEL